LKIFTNRDGQLVFALITLLGCILLWGVSFAQPDGDDGACYDCHSEYAASLEQSSHSAANKLVKVKCTSCHVDFEKHVSEPSADNITRPAKLTALETFEICSKCHFGKSEADYGHAGEHYKAGVNCLGCHQIHDAKAHSNAALSKSTINETCMSCHSKEKHQFTLKSQHPVLSGAMNCTDCHDYFKSLSADLTTKSNNQTCTNCHGEKDGPFLHEHESTRDYGVENGGCINCHNPHGSPFADLLKQEPKQLCLQCHQVPGHKTAHNGIYANENCLECHVDIHGSDNNRALLTQELNDDLNSVLCNQCHPRQ
jgi:DmsE family decaheme c-type cytochrome